MKVYLTRKIPEAGVSLLKKKYQVDIYPENRPIPRDLLLQKVEDCDALVCLLSDSIDEEIFARAGNLSD